MPERRAAWRQPLPARRPGCLPTDPALRRQGVGTDRDEHDDVEQLQRGSPGFAPAREHDRHAIEAAAGTVVTEMNTPTRAFAQTIVSAGRTGPTDSPLRIPAAYLELHARGTASRNRLCEPQRIGARKRPGGVPPVRE